MKIIISTDGVKFYVDDEDFENVNRYKWRTEIHGNTRRVCRKNCITKNADWIGASSTLLHRFILKAKKGKIIDHIDGNGLNNCRSNLRLCTHKENSRNTSSRKGSTSKYLGVSLNRRNNKWLCQIQVDGKNKFLGYFIEEWIAAHQYNVFSKHFFGDFARLNKIEYHG